jgi:hypothetical protein
MCTPSVTSGKQNAKTPPAESRPEAFLHSHGILASQKKNFFHRRNDWIAKSRLMPESHSREGGNPVLSAS